MNTTHKQRLLNAFQQGWIEPGKAYMQGYLLGAAGLEKSDLRKLERKGWALRNYTKNVWVEGEQLPNGRTVESGGRFVGKGHRVMWGFLNHKAGV